MRSAFSWILFEQAVEMIGREYNSLLRQNKVKNFLKSLRVSNFISEGMDTSIALEKV